MALEIPQRVQDRIWGRLAPPDANGCRRYLGSVNGKGYGALRWRTAGKCRKTTAHRVAYTATHGPIPDGYEVDHICFVTDCCTPEHLQLLTPEENRRRRAPPGFQAPPELTRSRLATTRVLRSPSHCPQGHDYATHGWARRAKGGRGYCGCLLCRSAQNAAYRRRKAAS